MAELESAGTQFAHVNLVAEDWDGLATFYESVFGCTRVLPERDLFGPWLEAGTGVPGAQIRGVHLRLPGYEQGGPTLEVFTYTPAGEAGARAPNCPGWAHIAFAVGDVSSVREAVLAAGGRAVGETISAGIEGAGSITFAYVADPEGNVIELQQWSSEH